VPREIKDNEFRVGLTPSAVREIVSHGHKVVVQAGAGEEIDLDDALYRSSGAEIVADAADVFGRADLVVKVKEPQPQRFAMLREGQILFTYLHLAPDASQTRGLLKAGVVAIALRDGHGRARRFAAARPDERGRGPDGDPGRRSCAGEGGGRARGVAGWSPGRAARKVVVLGGGVVGMNALRMALGLEADVNGDRPVPAATKELESGIRNPR